MIPLQAVSRYHDCYFESTLILTFLFFSPHSALHLQPLCLSSLFLLLPLPNLPWSALLLSHFTATHLLLFPPLSSFSGPSSSCFKVSTSTSSDPSKSIAISAIPVPPCHLAMMSLASALEPTT